MTETPSPPPPPLPLRAVALLAVAAFAAQAMVRVSDTLLPQIAADLDTTVGAASIVVTAYAVTHGSIQLIIGPFGDRFGKYPMVTLATAISAVTVAACGLAQSLGVLALARLASGATAAWIIPLSMAFIGDQTPYERRQQVLGRYLSGQILGQLFGQAAGGILGDWFGWRTVFFLLSGLFAIATVALICELMINPATRRAPESRAEPRSIRGDYQAVLANPWSRTILVVVFCEGALMFGPFAYVGADLHLRFGLSFTLVGACVAAFGIGGLIYALSVHRLVLRLGQSGLAVTGGSLLAAAYLALAVEPTWWTAPLLVTAIGLGYYMLHNTLQTNATQMTPEARGTAVAVFSAALYGGQTIGVALAAPMVDRYGAPVVFLIAAALLPPLGLWFSRAIRRHRQTAGLV